MSYRVMLTERAKSDLQEIGQWLFDRSPDGAHRWTLAAWEAIDRLPEKAAFSARAPENQQSDRDIRNIMFRTPKGRTYRLVFVIDGDQVTVTHVRGPGQNLISPDVFAE